MSSLQKAVAEINSTGNAKSGTATSFEVGGAGPGSAGAYKRSENLGAAASYTVGETGEAPKSTRRYSGNKNAASYTVGETGGAKGSSNAKSNKVVKVTKHFTIISDRDYEEEKKNSSSAMDLDYHDVQTSMDVDDKTGKRAPAMRRSSSKTQTFCHIGGTEEQQTNNVHTIGVASNDSAEDERQIEQMEGVIDQGTKMPLVVLDGANVAYAYAKVMAELNGGPSLNAPSSQLKPDVRGIQIATDFFLDAGLRALVVLPQYWFGGKRSTTNAITVTSQLEILSDLKVKGLVAVSPPTDDDDAYALTISRREESRSLKPPRNGEGPGFVLSNDLFRDAQDREPPSGTLKEWLTTGRNEKVGPGRISYTFGDMGSMNDRGERILDFVPNPRHPLVVWMENKGTSIDCTYCS